MRERGFVETELESHTKSLSDTHREQDRLVPQQLARKREPHSGRWRSASCTREAPACQGHIKCLVR